MRKGGLILNVSGKIGYQATQNEHNEHTQVDHRRSEFIFKQTGPGSLGEED